MADQEAIAARVAAGVEWLDATVEGWCDKIPKGALRLSSECRCICGWVFGKGRYHPTEGGYLSGFRFMERSTDPEDVWLIAHGFTTANGMWNALQREWERVLAMGNDGEVKSHG